MENKLRLGGLLKNNREKKGLTLEDVTRITKIRKEFLEALEEEEYSKLPERTYSLGYFRGYAKFLEIENVEILVSKLDKIYSFNSPEYAKRKAQVFLDEEYSLMNSIKKTMKKDSEDETKEDILTTSNSKRNKAKLDKSSFSSQKKLIIILLIFLFVFLLLGYNLLFNNAYNGEQLSSLITDKNLENKDNSISSVIDEDFVVVENKKNDDSSSSGYFQNKPQVDNNIKNENLEDIDQTKEEDEHSKHKVEIKYLSWPKETRNYQISIAFAEDVWIQIYKQDDPGIVYLDKIFKAGDIYDIPKVDNISMRVGNYKGVKVIVASKEVALTSKRRVSLVLSDIVLERDSLLSKYSLVE